MSLLGVAVLERSSSREAVSTLDVLELDEDDDVVTDDEVFDVDAGEDVAWGAMPNIGK